MHLLLTRGHPVYSAILPSTGPGNTKNVTAQVDAEYVRKHMLLPILDTEGHDVVVVMHSYSGIPGSAAAYGPGKKDREAAGKTTSVLGQIYIASLLEPSGILTYADPGPPLYSDVTPLLFQSAIVNSTLCPSYASWHLPYPRASWDQESFKRKIAFIRTLNDTGIPLQFQDMFMQNIGEEWMVRDMDTGHSPQLVQPERVCDVLIELARGFGLFDDWFLRQSENEDRKKP
ncbi:e270e43b-db82-4c61-af9d-ba165a004efc [Sclerotinia trifoliorum]|uniref:E270e43b-db82-4c61-af9d-ba165a004efc n=1 Tax=Sclerotinia trifoliorum TaxID=28548 RepID=A0A8H2ZKK0_9HELO|nr:e270e43b-db82-4c61-af9d-ba165a004efc [Sclerotinia trifoliorum]